MAKLSAIRESQMREFWEARVERLFSTASANVFDSASAFVPAFAAASSPSMPPSPLRFEDANFVASVLF